MLEVAFSEEGMVYRDEIGRYLRKMHPYSIPALIRGQHQDEDASLSRYARYQLERLDREEPGKAMAAAATDEQLSAEILRAYQDTKFRQAVNVVLDYVDHVSPAVRRAARDTWMSYVTGPPPPPAPKRRLQLPGGRYTDKPEPLWLTYRELAEVELDKRYQELFGEDPARGMSLEDQSTKVFAHYDQQRDAAIEAIRAEGAGLADSGDHAGAVARFDRILAVRPTFERRAEMAPAYLAHARQLEKDESWRPAAAAYAKAHALAPQADTATDALAGYHYALGRALEAEGGDGSASYARAVQLQPDYAPAREAAERTGVVEPRRRWMLYAGVAGGAAAVLLLGLGLVLRRRHHARPA
jgi:tetratricopeptide (TPR) repeat protein